MVDVLIFLSWPCHSFFGSLSWPFYPGCPGLAFPLWLSCTGCPALAVLHWLSCSCCPVVTFCFGCPVGFRLSCFGCSIQAVLISSWNSMQEVYRNSADIWYQISVESLIPYPALWRTAFPSLRYWKFRYQTQSDIAHRWYQTEYPPIAVKYFLIPSTLPGCMTE